MALIAGSAAAGTGMAGAAAAGLLAAEQISSLADAGPSLDPFFAQLAPYINANVASGGYASRTDSFAFGSRSLSNGQRFQDTGSRWWEARVGNGNPAAFEITSEGKFHYSSTTIKDFWTSVFSGARLERPLPTLDRGGLGSVASSCRVALFNFGDVQWVKGGAGMYGLIADPSQGLQYVWLMTVLERNAGVSGGPTVRSLVSLGGTVSAPVISSALDPTYDSSGTLVRTRLSNGLAHFEYKGPEDSTWTTLTSVDVWGFEPLMIFYGAASPNISSPPDEPPDVYIDNMKLELGS